MTNTKTSDIEATVKQITELAMQVVILSEAVDMDAAKAICEIKKQITLPQ